VDDKKYTHAREVTLQFIRFNFVGIMNTALTYAVYAALVFIGANHFVALGADYAVGIVFSFVMNKRLTFKVKGRASIRMFARMVGSYVVLLMLNALILWALVDRSAVNTYLGQAIALVAVALVSFAVQRFVVFREHKRKPSGARH
jgi:putative flippase GtrA